MTIRRSAILVQMFKELQQFRRDKLTVALAFILPVCGLMMYGFATRLEAKDIRVAIYDYDNSELSRSYADTIYSSLQLTPAEKGGPDPLSVLDRSLARAVIVVPPEFTRNIKAERQAPIEVIIDASDVNNARIAKNDILAATQAFSQLHAPASVRYREVVHPAVRLWYNPGRRESLYIVPGAIGLLLWIFPAMLAALSLAREKEQGTILQVYASNLTSVEFLSGKAIAYIVVGMGEALCLLVASLILFQLTFRGGIVMFGLCTALFVTTSVLFGIWAATRARDQMTAIQIVSNVGFLSTMLLSGFIYPLRNVVFPLNLAAYVVPAMYFVKVCRNEFVRGSDWGALWYVPFIFLAFDVLLARAIFKMPMKLQAK